MYRFLIVPVVLSAIVFSLSCRGVVQQPAFQTCAPIKAPSEGIRIVVVMLDNMKYEFIHQNPAAPFLNKLMAENTYASNYFGSTWPSIGNYLMLTSGRVPTNDNRYMGTVSSDNFVRQFCQAGISWKSYAESLPEPGYLADKAYPYVRPHNPLSYYDDVFFNPEQAAKLVPLEQLFVDLENDNLPTYSMIVPNQVNNMHDCPFDKRPCDGTQENGIDPKVAAGDAFLQRVVPPILANSSFARNGLLIVVTDHAWPEEEAPGCEPCGLKHGGGHVLWVAAGSRAKKGFRTDTFYQHPSTVRLVADLLGIARLGEAAKAPDMSEVLAPAPMAGAAGQ